MSGRKKKWKRNLKKVQRREFFSGAICMVNIWIFLKILGIVPGISLFTEKNHKKYFFIFFLFI